MEVQSRGRPCPPRAPGLPQAALTLPWGTAWPVFDLLPLGKAGVGDRRLLNVGGSHPFVRVWLGWGLS